MTGLFLLVTTCHEEDDVHNCGYHAGGHGALDVLREEMPTNDTPLDSASDLRLSIGAPFLATTAWYFA